jgi:hypothetical protein
MASFKTSQKEKEKAAREEELDISEYNAATNNASDRKLSTEISVKEDDNI